MSNHRKKLFIPTLILCVQIFLAACAPEIPYYGIYDNVGDVGEPQVACSKVGELEISFQVAPKISGGNVFAYMDIKGRDYDFYVNNPKWNSDFMVYYIKAPTVETVAQLILHNNYNVERLESEPYIEYANEDYTYCEFDLRTNESFCNFRETTRDKIKTDNRTVISKFWVTLPTCEFEGASPPEEEALDSNSKQRLYDGKPIIQSAKCVVTFTDRYMLNVDINFPQSSDGLNAEYEAFFDGVPLGSPRHLINDTLRFEQLHPGYSPLPETFLLRSLPFHEAVLETTIEWQDCDAYPDTNIPVIYSATCLKGSQLMVVFEFPEHLTSEYEALVDGQEYQYTPVPNYPNRAYFLGPPPKYQGPVSVSLSTIPDGAVVFEQQDFKFPACGVQRPRKDEGGGDGGYVPPSY